MIRHSGNFDYTCFNLSLSFLKCNQQFNTLNGPYYLKIHQIFAFNDPHREALFDFGFIRGKFENICREAYVESLRKVLKDISLCYFWYLFKIYLMGI